MDDRKTQIYVGIVCLAATVALIVMVVREPTPPLMPLLLFALLAFASESLAVTMSESVLASVSLSIYIAALLLFGPLLASVAGIAGALSWSEISRKVPAYKIAFNASQEILSIAAAGFVYETLGGGFGLAWRFPGQLGPTLLAGATYFSVNVLLVAGVVAFAERTSLTSVLRGIFPFMGSQAAQLALAVVLAHVYLQVGPAGLVLLIAPLLVARQTLQVYVNLKAAYEETVRSLVAAIEAKDAYTKGHSERVADYAEMIGHQLRMPEEQINKLRIAALLHDLGKIGIQRRILSKTGRLSEDEFALMQEHPELATEILKEVDFLEDVIPTIYHHHEHYDGSGYAKSLRGEQIPLTARILAVADAYDAMISVRPYRDAREPEAAAAELLQCSGSQFDQRIVDALISATGVQPQAEGAVGLARGQMRIIEDSAQ